MTNQPLMFIFVNLVCTAFDKNLENTLLHNKSLKLHIIILECFTKKKLYGMKEFLNYNMQHIMKCG